MKNSTPGMTMLLKRKRRMGVLLLVLVALQANLGMAQSQEKIYSLMLINFAKGIYWPGTALSKEKFIIGVLGYPPLVTELRQTSLTTKISGKRIEVKELATPAEATGCHILFLPAYKAKWIPELLTSIATEPTLVVSNKTGFAKRGGAINFVLLEGKLNYEINCPAIEKKGMKIGSAVKKMGIQVE